MNEDPLVSAYIARLEGGRRLLAEELRFFIGATLPQARECLKWSLPFYAGPKKNLCYLNAPPKTDGAYVGFYRGALLDDPFGLLTGEGKQVRHFVCAAPGEWNEEALRHYLLEGWALAR